MGGVSAGVSVSFDFYLSEYGGDVAAPCFDAFLGAAVRQVDWLCGGRAPGCDDDEVAYRRAVCAAVNAFAEFGEGQVGRFSLGEFKVANYEDEGTTGAEIANAAALKELRGTGLLFSGVR